MEADGETVSTSSRGRCDVPVCGIGSCERCAPRCPTATSTPYPGTDASSDQGHPIIKSAELFSIERYEEVIDAYLRGLADRGDADDPSCPWPRPPSRIDTTFDGGPGT
jgi:hypothetical protein